ncbi:MAG: hypothetical protein PUE61_11865 [Clostridiales bacterium]|nr:hypothetical protein [Clostridiales bacterium]
MNFQGWRCCEGAMTEMEIIENGESIINPMTRIFVTVDGETKTFEPFFDPQLQDHFRYAYSGAFLKDFPDCRPGEAPVAAFRIPEILDRLGNLTATLDFGVSEAALLFLSQSGQ